MLPRAGVVTPAALRDYILPYVVYRGCEFSCYPINLGDDLWALKISRPVTDAYNPERTAMQRFQSLIYGDFASEDDAVKFVFKTIMEMEQHEAGEWFHYAGVRTFDPHAARRGNGAGDVARLPAPSVRGVVELPASPSVSHPR